MPPLQSMSFDNGFKFVTSDGVENEFNSLDIPLGIDTEKSLEDYINNSWIPPLVNGEYQMQVHVFTLEPLSLTAWCGDIGQEIPNNWWDD